MQRCDDPRPDGTVTVTAEGNGGVPASGVSAVVANVTVADTSAQSHLTVFPGGQTEPTASNLNWVAGQTVPNLVTVGLSAAGTFEAENLSGTADVIVDIEGYYGAGVRARGCTTPSPPPPGSATPERGTHPDSAVRPSASARATLRHRGTR